MEKKIILLVNTIKENGKRRQWKGDKKFWGKKTNS
jgi:hypothetical protein